MPLAALHAQHEAAGAAVQAAVAVARGAGGGAAGAPRRHGAGGRRARAPLRRAAGEQPGAWRGRGAPACDGPRTDSASPRFLDTRAEEPAPPLPLAEALTEDAALERLAAVATRVLAAAPDVQARNTQRTDGLR